MAFLKVRIDETGFHTLMKTCVGEMSSETDQDMHVWRSIKESRMWRSSCTVEPEAGRQSTEQSKENAANEVEEISFLINHITISKWLEEASCLKEEAVELY